MKPGTLQVWRKGLAACCVLILLAAGTGWLLGRGDRGGVIASILALTVAVLALAVQLTGWPRHVAQPDDASLSAAALSLARDVAQREQAEQNLLLGGSARAVAANLTFAAPDQVSWPTKLVTWRSSEGQGRESGSLADIAEFYSRHEDGRIVILGQPGSGKTVLVTQLLLDLVKKLAASDQEPAPRVQVPVRMSLPAFDPGSGGRTPALVASRLDAWMASYLTDVFGLGKAVARALVGRGWILPVLDGLDEMDQDSEETPRAAAVARALNYPGPGGLRHVVLACRNDRYQQLAAVVAAPGMEAVLQDAAAIEIQPMGPSQVASFLARRFPDPSGRDVIQSRWRPVAASLQAIPRSPLAQALGSPLRLFIAVTAYHDLCTDPAELTQLTAAELDQHLLERFVPAITRQHQPPGGACYEAADVTRWLRTLARHLDSQQLGGGSGTDLNLATLWTAAGSWTRYASAALHGLTAGIPLLAAGSLFLYLYGLRAMLSPVSLASLILSLALIALLTWRASRRHVSINRLDLSLSQATGSPLRLALCLMAGFGFGLASQFTALDSAFVLGLGGQLILGLCCGLALWLWAGLRRAPSAIRRPSQLVTQGRTYDLAIRLSFGLGVGLLLGLGVGLVPIHAVLSIPNYAPGASSYTDIWPASLPDVYPAFEISLGISIGFMLGGLLDADSPWLRYAIATRMLARTGELPSRPARFLDWAHTAGLVRMAGTMVQFRHRDLQQALAEERDSET